jgi:hypothetical protein
MRSGIHEAIWAKVQYKVVCRKAAVTTEASSQVREHLGPFGGNRPGMTISNVAWLPAWEAIDA